MNYRLLPGQTARQALKATCQGLTREQKRQRADVAWLVGLIITKNRKDPAAMLAALQRRVAQLEAKVRDMEKDQVVIPPQYPYGQPILCAPPGPDWHTHITCLGEYRDK